VKAVRNGVRTEIIVPATASTWAQSPAMRSPMTRSASVISSQSPGRRSAVSAAAAAVNERAPTAIGLAIRRGGPASTVQGVVKTRSFTQRCRVALARYWNTVCGPLPSMIVLLWRITMARLR